MLFIMQPEKPKRTLKASPFILKLAQILDTPEYEELISWTPCHQSFTVHQPYQFSSILLPKYFRHSNYGSFLRQLNFYSFMKVKHHNDDIHQFQHPLFIRGREQNYKLIKRQKPQAEKDGEQSTGDSQNELARHNGKEALETLEQKIHSLKQRQSKLMEQCRETLEQGNQTIEWGFIKSAEVQNESSHNQIICHKIFDFIKHNPQFSDRFHYLDTTIINNILEHLGSPQSKPYPPFLDDLFRMVESTELFDMMYILTSALTKEHKKIKNFTIVNPTVRKLPCEGLKIDYLPKELTKREVIIRSRKQ